jgi:chromatin segregation and condensation protein Rec8/ScpA/Scc1 (kleisin family)
VLTFIPLLHLATRRKIDLDQKIPFGEISILLRPETDLNRELTSFEEAKPQ